MSRGMDHLGRCRDCGKTVRWLDNLPSTYKVMVDAETTGYEDTSYDASRHTSHWQTCPVARAKMGQQSAAADRQPCGCGE